MVAGLVETNGEGTAMATVKIEVRGMSCDHCNRAMERAVAQVGGRDVAGDFTTGTVKATFEVPPDERAVRAAIEDEGYDLVSIGEA
jgi:copper chaperone